MREKEKYFMLRSTYSFGNGILFELRGVNTGQAIVNYC